MRPDRWLTLHTCREIAYAPAELLPKGLDADGTRRALVAAIELLEKVPFEEAEMEAAFRALAPELGVKAGQLFSILRVAITGKAVAPPLFGSLIAVGRECALERCRAALERVPASRRLRRRLRSGRDALLLAPRPQRGAARLARQICITHTGDARMSPSFGDSLIGRTSDSGSDSRGSNPCPRATYPR